MITKVAEGIYRGPRLEDTKELLKFKTVVNLENDLQQVEYEREFCEDLHDGVQFIHEPMSEFARPNSCQLAQIALRIANPIYHPVYVHCKHGQDRTGYVIAAFRMLVQGWSFKLAYQEAKDMGHKWWFAPYLLFWPKSLKAVGRIERTEMTR